jgi:hypothetical protein
MYAEISYDLVMENDMSFVEGTYRLPGREWRVFIFSRKDVAEPHVEQGSWESGVSGAFVHFPRSARLDQTAVERVLAGALEVREWVVVRGPDSMHLR